MDTVSYLTINDETKEIADITSRNSIENIAATIAAHDNDIGLIRVTTGPGGTIANSINDAYVTAYAAQSAAVAAIEAATTADEKATSAGEAANLAWDYADSASNAAQEAWDRAGDAADAALAADIKAEEAGASANAAQSSAESATQAAGNAWDRAGDAANAAAMANSKAEAATLSAQAAQNSATQANTYATGALAGLSTLESVIDTVNWFADHRTRTTDIFVDSNKNYYTYDQQTGSMSKIEPWGGENPSEEGWYELDESIQNYIASHVAETDDGLYVLSTVSGWRVLVSTGGGNYTPGVFIVSPQGIIKQAMTGDGITFDSTSPFSIGDEDAYIVFDGNGHITIGGDGVEIYSPITVGNSRKTLSEVLNDLGQAITSIQYGVGNSPNNHNDIIEWSNNSPQWEFGKYIWMRTSTNGLSYTYTCIQGIQGPRGETGPKGETGTPGGEGVGILSVEVSYAISDSGEIMPEDEEWKNSIEQWYSYYDDEEGETGYTGEVGYTGHMGYTGEEFVEEDLLTLEQGKWLWIRTITTYSDFTSSITYQKSYIGTDGQDGKSIFIQSTSKENGITTIVLEDSDGNTETITIADGEDGTDGIPGQPGVDGKTFYTHFAWAENITIDNSTTPPTVNATGFDKQDSLNKLYIGVYSDENIADSNNPGDYSWTLIKGEDGTSVTITNISYAISNTGETQPTTFPYSSTPVVNKGQWLWVKTTYSDGNITVTKSYVGTDGEDGTSVNIQSISKENGVTTVVLIDGENNPQTLTIADGEDGAAGTAGLNGYIHTAWATAADGSQGFSTTVSIGKTYLGVYTDNTATDSNNPQDYSWSLIKGADGQNGKILNILSGIYTISNLPSIGSVDEGDAYLVDDGDGQYDLYYKGTGANTWTIVEDWQGVPGPKGETGDPGTAGPEAIVTIVPSNINWDANNGNGSATLTAILRVNGIITTPTSWVWTKGTSTTSLTQQSNHTLTVDDLNATYNCTVTW